MNAWLNLVHPSEGEWRAYLDGELPSTRHQYLDRHLAGCARCRSRFAEVQKTATLAAARLGALRTLAEVAPTPPFPAHLRSGAEPDRPVTLKEAPPMTRTRFYGRVAAAAAALALVSSLFVPGVRAAAAEWLTVFRAKDARVVRINPADFKPGTNLNLQSIAAEQLQKLVQIEQTAKPRQIEGLTLAELKGYSFRAPAYLPEGFTAGKGVLIGQAEALVKLDVDGINQLLGAAGSKTQLPAELKGQVIRINSGPTTGMVYEKGEQRLLVAQTAAPTLAASGQVDVNKTADLLMSSLGTELGLPSSLQAQLRSMDLSRTMPIPVVEGQSDEVKVKGLTGAYYHDQSGSNGAVVWMSQGQIRVVQGPLSRAELLKVAESLED